MKKGIWDIMEEGYVKYKECIITLPKPTHDKYPIYSSLYTPYQLYEPYTPYILPKDKIRKENKK